MRFQAAPISTLPAKILKSGPPLLDASSGENFALVLSCSVLMKPLRVPSSAFVKVPMLAIVILLWFSFEATTIAASMAINCRGRSWPQPHGPKRQWRMRRGDPFLSREEDAQRRGKKVEPLI